jgi:hypothetical protein
MHVIDACEEAGQHSEAMGAYAQAAEAGALGLGPGPGSGLGLP